MPELRLLSVKQPWASLLVHGTKQLEVRSWQTSYRGPVAIRASGRITKGLVGDMAHDDALYEATVDMWDRSPDPLTYEEIVSAIREAFPVGGVIGLATLTDCRPLTEWAKRKWKTDERHLSFGGRKRPGPGYGLLFEMPVVVPGRPIAAPGMLNLVRWSSRNKFIEQYCRKALRLLQKGAR